MLLGAGFRSIRWLHGREQQGLVGAIQRVDGQWIADGLHMYANLMAAPSVRMHVQQRIASKALDHGIAGEGGLAMTALNGHHARSLWMRPDGQANATFGTNALATYQSEIGFQDFSMFELL